MNLDQAVDLFWAHLAPRGEGMVHSPVIVHHSWDPDEQRSIWHDGDIGRVEAVFRTPEPGDVGIPDDFHIHQGTTIRVDRRSPAGRYRLWLTNKTFGGTHTVNFSGVVDLFIVSKGDGMAVCPVCGGTDVIVRTFVDEVWTRAGTRLDEFPPRVVRRVKAVCRGCGTPAPDWKDQT